MYNIEVYKQPKRFTTEFEVRKDWRLMHGRNGLDRLDLCNHKILRQQIDAIAELQLHATVDDRKPYLSSGLGSCPIEFVLQASCASAL